MSVSRKATESVLLSVGAAFGDRVIGFIVFAIVVRFVDTRAVGLVALSAQFVDLANALAGSGFGERVMQKRDLDARGTATLFWTHALITLPTVLLLAGLGQPLAWFLDEPDLPPILLLLSLSLVLNVFVTVPAGLLARELRYRPITLLSVLSTLFGGVVAIALAVSGHGLWALALQRVAGVAFYAAGTMVVTRYRPMLAFDVAECRASLGFALPLMGSQGLNVLPPAVTSTIVGHYLGIDTVGVLRIAQRLNELLMQLIVLPAMRVFVPVFSGMTKDRERMRETGRRVIDALALPVLPLFAIAAVVALPLTRVAFGAGWERSAELFQIMSLTAPRVVVGTVAWPLLVGVGMTGDVFRLKLLEVVVSIVSAFVFSPFGLMAYVWGAVAAASLLLFPNARLIGKALGQEMWVPLRQLVAPSLAALVTFAIGHWVIDPALPPMHPVLWLGALGAATGAVALALLAMVAWGRLKALAMFVLRNISPASRGASQ
ncbi:MAG: oligosaccharide flippase family protein [Acetobacteraceae bacterium]|jgi:O-antigen/teichoic acid export membrane protein|nr:oligosaccharide flippase family protein [Acetobacteraceae bacterium]